MTQRQHEVGRAGAPVVALLVVPNGTYRPQPLADAIGRWHPDWQVAAVWCGDPQLHPSSAGSLAWAPLDHPPADAERIVSGSDPHVAEWRLAVPVAAAALRAGAECVVLLWVGAVAVLGDLTPLVGAGSPLTVLARSSRLLAGDEAPDEDDLVREGPYSTDVVAVRAGGLEALEAMVARLSAPGLEAASVGPRLARAAEVAGAAVCAHPAVGVGPWRWEPGRPSLIDVPRFDSRQPWVLDGTSGRPARVALVGHPDRQAAMSEAGPQLAGRREPLALPGGIRVDETIRSLVAGSDGSAPAPWSEAAAFRGWLTPRYWTELHRSRADLASAFPDPVSADRDGFARWCAKAFAHDTAPFLVAPTMEGFASVPRFPVEEELRSDGINLVGYLRHESSLGDVARRLAAGLREAGVPSSAIAVGKGRTNSPLLRAAHPADDCVRFDTTVAIVNADQFPHLVHDHPEVVRASRRMIGYWFWELEYVPKLMRNSFRWVDEIWAGSRFVADAFASVAHVPVHHVPIPVAEPVPSSRTRSSFPAIADAGDRFMFLVHFDHLSIAARKNPVGAVQAFRRAFADGEGPLLVIKSMNGAERWPHHQALAAAAEGRTDVVLWDEHLDRGDHMALVASADCLVSLHRSEGLGLHLAEAMWLGTPTIATRYSGNLDFMDDDCALLVDWRPTPVVGGQGVYPEGAVWAEPDTDQAAEAMRRIVADGALHRRLAAAGRKRMEDQPTLADAGRLVASIISGGE